MNFHILVESTHDGDIFVGAFSSSEELKAAAEKYWQEKTKVPPGWEKRPLKWAYDHYDLAEIILPLGELYDYSKHSYTYIKPPELPPSKPPKTLKRIGEE